jgi:hypothetical protein
MDSSTISSTTFGLKQGTTPVAGTVSYLGTTAKFKPTSNLVANTVYVATVTTGAKDLAGNALAAVKTWSFTTGAALAVGPEPVVLGTAGDFAVLAKTLISTTAAAGTAVTAPRDAPPPARPAGGTSHVPICVHPRSSASVSRRKWGLEFHLFT